MILRQGSKGASVKAVQIALKAAGFNLVADGDFGSGTYRAVKQFQSSHGLVDDGDVGPRTLSALGLDSEARPVSGAGGTAAVPTEEITFKPEDVDAPAVVKAKIREFADEMERAHDALIGRMQDALANFETTMLFASSEEAKPNIVGTVVSAVFEFGVDTLIDVTGEAAPYLKLAKTIFTKTREEIERAGRAAASHKVGEWIQQQRTTVGNMRGTFDVAGLRQEVEVEYLEAPDRNRYFASLQRDVERYRTPPLPSVQDLQTRLFVRWINVNSTSDTGFIDIKFDATGDLEWDSCAVKTVDDTLDDRIGDALNNLMGVATGFRAPLDLPVRKRVQFYSEDLVPGGKDWSWGWLDERNRKTGAPVLPEGAKVWDKDQWQGLVTKFKRN